MIRSQIFMKNNLLTKVLITRYCSNNPQETTKNVGGLSDKVFSKPVSAVELGTKKTGDYKVLEYFCFDQHSFYEAELELVKYRPQQQPSAKQEN